MAAKVIWWAFTLKKDFRGLLKLFRSLVNVFPWPPPWFDFNPMGLEPKRNTIFKANLFGDCFGILYGTRGFLQQAIDYCNLENGVYSGSGLFPTLPQVFAYLASLNIKFGREAEYLSSLKARLGILIDSLGKAANFRIGLDLRHTLGTCAVFELPLDVPPEIRRYYILSVIQWLLLYRSQMPPEELASQNQIVVILDDAWEVADAALDRDGVSQVGSLLLLGRQLKVSFCICSQLPSRLSSAVFGSHATMAAFRLPSEQDRRRVSEAM